MIRPPYLTILTQLFAMKYRSSKLSMFPAVTSSLVSYVSNHADEATSWVCTSWAFQPSPAGWSVLWSMSSSSRSDATSMGGYKHVI